MIVPGCTDNNWHQFMIDYDGKQVSVTAKPNVWNKFKAQAKHYKQQ